MDDAIEARLAELLRAGALHDAATCALEAYGREIFGYLRSILDSDGDAGEVYSQIAEDLWRGLPAFRGRSSVRTWLYVLARHAAARFRRTPWNQPGRRAGDERLDALVAHTRSQTQPWLRTEVKARWRALRDALDPDDRSLLVLRVDRKLEWKEIARVMLGEEAGGAALAREADRLKKRFQLLKDELRRRAREAGLNDEK
jgi:RNA polymerase sigma-70 factor, ECF subfamily